MNGFVTCGGCAHWTPNTANPAAGMGTCALNAWHKQRGPHGRAHAPYPTAERVCSKHQPRK
ncbi:MAG: hypothetical protein ACREVL_16490 [Solimonas sp.]